MLMKNLATHHKEIRAVMIDFDAPSMNFIYDGSLNILPTSHS